MARGPLWGLRLTTNEREKMSCVSQPVQIGRWVVVVWWQRAQAGAKKVPLLHRCAESCQLGRLFFPLRRDIPYHRPIFQLRKVIPVLIGGFRYCFGVYAAKLMTRLDTRSQFSPHWPSVPALFPRVFFSHTIDRDATMNIDMITNLESEHAYETDCLVCAM